MSESLIARVASRVARDIMSVGDRPDSVAQRIQIKGGTWPDNETDNGGLCEQGLAMVIAGSLREQLSEL